MSVKLLTEHHLSFLSLKEGCTGLSESTLVKMPNCWKSHVTAHLLINYTVLIEARQFWSDVSRIKRLAKAMIRLCVSAGWSEPLLVAYTTLLEI